MGSIDELPEVYYVIFEFCIYRIGGIEVIEEYLQLFIFE
jgi:hypothetical protein